MLWQRNSPPTPENSAGGSRLPLLSVASNPPLPPLPPLNLLNPLNPLDPCWHSYCYVPTKNPDSYM